MTTNHDLDNVLPQYATTDEIAAWVGRTPGWVRDNARRGIAAPCLFKGRRQFDRRGTLRFLVLSRLQEMFDQRSSVPFELLKAAEPAIDELLANPASRTLFIRPGVGLTFVVFVPSLKALLTA